MDIPLYIADTPCIIRVSQDDKVIEVLALDQGGSNFGPRRVSVTKEMLEDITDYVKMLASGLASKRGMYNEEYGTGDDDNSVRGYVPEQEGGPSEAGQHELSSDQFPSRLCSQGKPTKPGGDTST